MVNQARTENIPATYLSAVGASSETPQVRKIYIQDKLAQAFPRTFAEALAPPHSLESLYSQSLAKQQSTGNNHAFNDYNGQSSACLFLALKQYRCSGSVDPETLLSTSERKNRFLGTPSDDGLMEIVDAWGSPLAFIRVFTDNTTDPTQAKFDFVVFSPGKNANLGTPLSANLSGWVTTQANTIGDGDNIDSRNLR